MNNYLQNPYLFTSMVVRRREPYILCILKSHTHVRGSTVLVSGGVLYPHPEGIS